jgi:hypothetical protein
VISSVVSKAQVTGTSCSKREGGGVSSFVPQAVRRRLELRVSPIRSDLFIRIMIKKIKVNDSSTYVD